jgi:signal transduction histidine kinase
MITELRPAVLDELGLLTAIQWQVLEFENRSGVNCHITNLQHGVSFEPVISTAIFRILQEALDNVKRHSSATDAFISLQVADSTLVLEVSDNGVGIRPDKIKSPDSIGIISIRERVHSLGGKLEVRGEPGHGTTLIVSIPLSK